MSNTNVNSSTSALSSLNLDMLMRMLQEETAKTRSSPLSPVDTIGKGTKKAETAVSLTNEGVALPPPKSTKDSNSQSQLDQLAKDFAKFYTMMAKSAQLQTQGLSDEIEYVQESNTFSMAAAQTAISKQETLLKEQTAAGDKEAKMAKTQSTLKTVTWIITGIVIGLTVLSAIVTFGASLAAVPEEVEMGAVVIGAEEGVADGAADLAVPALEDGAEEGAAEGASAGMTSVEGLGVSADYGSSLVDDAAMEGMEDAGDSTLQKASQALKGKLFRTLMSLSVTGTQVASQSYEAAADFTTAKFDTQIAGAEQAFGSAAGEFKMTSSYNQFWQNQLGRSTETLTNISKTLSEIPATFGQILQTLRQATLTANQKV
ncbi:MAG: hypothetical protein K1000chlam4_00526 [Chlamydiae bacterium]|nr:hypothetical protein [Chlamydiota bacterium]